MDERRIGFRPVTHDDLPLLRRWMETPHWREWWGDPDVEHGYVVDMIEGRDTTEPYLITLDGEAVGYIQRWFIGHNQTPAILASDPWVGELPPDAQGIDLSIGEASLLSKGLGSTALRQFIGWIRRTGARTIIIDPDPANIRAVRAYTKAGFQPIPYLLGRTPGVLIMQHQEVHQT